MMMFSNFTGLIEVKAAGIATTPKITLAAAGSKVVTGTGLLGNNRKKNGNITTIIYVTVKNGDDIIEEASTTIEPKTKGPGWTVELQNELVAGYTVYVKQQSNTDMSDEVSAVVKETLASKHKTDLTMPSGEIWIEKTNANLVNDDEQAEAVKMLKNVNPAIVGDIASVKFSINTAEHAYYEVTYTDNSTSGKIEAPGLKIKQVTEYSRGAELGSITIVDNVIKGQLSGEGPFDGIKVQILLKLSNAVKDSYCDGGKCLTDKDTSDPVSATVDGTTGEFSYTIPNPDLKLDQKVGVTVKEPHKFKSCSQTAVTAPIPKKTEVKDPKKLTAENKKAIDAAIREAYTINGVSKLPNGTGDYKGVPAVIQIDDSGIAKVFRGNDVKGTWDSNYNFVPETNTDGSYKVNENAVPTATFPAKDLVKNIAPDTPKMENKEGNVVITPNIAVDTDAKKVIVEYEDKSGNKKTVTATKGDTGWTVDDNNAKVDENGVVSIPTKEVKPETIVNAYVVDEGGLVPEETALNSTKGELKIENKYKITYDPNGGEGTMKEEEVNAGSNYRISENKFTPPTDKEFDHWMIGFEPKKPGETTEVNNDITIKAIWKYIINPKVDKITTTVDHPINYEMYKNAISGYPDGVTVEHIEVNTKPDLSKIGGSKAEIEVRFSDGQFRKLTVPIEILEDPKDKEIEKLNKDIEGLNQQITDLNNKISEKDGKITELNGKITELEGKLQECQNQCAIDKAECEKAKEALNKQIQDLTVEKTRLETVVHDYDKLIKEMKEHQETLNKQITDLKETVKGKDAEIAKLLEKIGGLETKIETLTTENTDLKEKLATTNQKILDLESKVTDLEGQVKDLTKKLNTKETEIKALNDTITSLKEEIAKLETEKAKDKDAYDKEKANLEKQIQDAKDTLTTKETELKEIKDELKTANDGLATEKAKTAGLEEQVKAKDEMITKLNKDIEELKAQLAKAKDGNTTIIKEKETIIKEKETLIENLKTEKAEAEKQLAAEKAKNEEITKQLTELKEKADKAENDLKTANDNITDLKVKLAFEQEKNKTLTEKVTELTEKVKKAEDENKTLKAKIEELNKQLAEAQKSQCDVEELNKLKQDKAALEAKLEGKDEMIKELRNQIAELKKSLTDKDTEYKEKIKELEEKINNLTTENTSLKEQLATANERIKNLENQLQAEKEKNKQLEKEKAELEEAKKDLEKDKKYLQDKAKNLENKVNVLTTEKEKLQKEIDKLKAQLEKCPADATEKINKLKAEIEEKEKLIEEKDKSIAEKNKLIKELQGNLDASDKMIKQLEERIKVLESRPREKEYIKEYVYVKDRDSRSCPDCDVLRRENDSLRRENQELRDKIARLERNNNCDKSFKEKYVTIFSLNSILYKTYLDEELMTQAEMTDFKGYIKPFVSNNRTMLPMRYVALSLGLDVNWDNATRTATFTNNGRFNALNPGQVTINADTFEMKDQYGKVIDVDSKPIIKDGRIYISITNLIKAFGGSNGNLNDGMKNTVKWDQAEQRVLVYKYIN